MSGVQKENNRALVADIVANFTGSESTNRVSARSARKF